MEMQARCGESAGNHWMITRRPQRRWMWYFLSRTCLTLKSLDTRSVLLSTRERDGCEWYAFSSTYTFVQSLGFRCGSLSFAFGCDMLGVSS